MSPPLLCTSLALCAPSGFPVWAQCPRYLGTLRFRGKILIAMSFPDSPPTHIIQIVCKILERAWDPAVLCDNRQKQAHPCNYTCHTPHCIVVAHRGRSFSHLLIEPLREPPASRLPLMGLGRAVPEVGFQFGVRPTEETRGVMHRVSVGDRCAGTVIAGILSMRCAVMCGCWSPRNHSRGSPLPNV